jgi:hypothetical protein
MISRQAVPAIFQMYHSFIENRLAKGVKIKVWPGWVPDQVGGELHGLTAPDLDDESHFTVHIASAEVTNQVTTLLHEFAHKMFPDATEDWIRGWEIELVSSFSTEQLKSFEKYLKPHNKKGRPAD